MHLDIFFGACYKIRLMPHASRLRASHDGVYDILIRVMSVSRYRNYLKDCERKTYPVTVLERFDGLGFRAVTLAHNSLDIFLF